MEEASYALYNCICPSEEEVYENPYEIRGSLFMFFCLGDIEASFLMI